MVNNELQCMKCGVFSTLFIGKSCYFCWYDFDASDDERLKEQETEIFREKSINQWYKKLNIDRVMLSFWSPITLMHIFHDCFRSQSTTTEMTLKLAAGIFPESVAWLKRLIKGTVPCILTTEEGHRVYKFGAGIDRTSIWYYKKDHWYWSTDWPVNQWIQCPLLTVTFEPWTGQIPREDNIFIISMSDKLISVEKENLEDLTIILLDQTSNDLNTKTRIRCIINFLKIFTDINICLDYIHSIPNENIFIIVSGRLSSILISLIEDLPQILHVYIFCYDIQKYSSLKSIIQMLNNFMQLIRTKISYTTEKCLRNLTNERALLDIPPSDEAKVDLLKLARKFYVDNDLELLRIDDFEKTYESIEALKWYTSDSFAYRLLNKAIRTENIDLLFSCRFFIRDLHQ
ncbi:hypothetical protein I4U23_031526 [Adineta vaga]|nr:hypothetical protein I4U23_031526 [Adineta vaga]